MTSTETIQRLEARREQLRENIKLLKGHRASHGYFDKELRLVECLIEALERLSVIQEAYKGNFFHAVLLRQIEETLQSISARLALK